MFKKILLRLLVLLGACVLTAQAEWKFDVTTTAGPKVITMLVVPRDATAVQIANDISKDHRVLLVCYQQTDELLKIHAWNGKSWVNVPVEDYTNGMFFTHAPTHAILVEPEGSPAPEILVPDGVWCASGNRLTSTDPRVMIHLLGRYFDFPYRTWKDFSRRYELPIEKINPALINITWLHHYGEDLFKKRALRDPKADLDKWLYLDITPPPPVEPVVIEAEPAVIPPVEIPAVEPVKPEEPEAVAEEVSAAVKEPEAVMEEKPAPVEKPVEVPDTNDVEKILADLADVPEPAPKVVVDPFSAREIPAAEVILPPAE